MSDTLERPVGLTIVSQIGIGNMMAISGRRAILTEDGVVLPVGCGYSVTVDLVCDTYRVRRIFKRGLKTWIKGELAGVYCDQVGEIAYQASCFRNVKFGEHDPR